MVKYVECVEFVKCVECVQSIECVQYVESAQLLSLLYMLILLSARLRRSRILVTSNIQINSTPKGSNVYSDKVIQIFDPEGVACFLPPWSLRYSLHEFCGIADSLHPLVKANGNE